MVAPGGPSHVTHAGFSLFALLDDACHAPGRQRLREWMMRPSRDIDIIRARHKAIDVLMQPLNVDVLKQIRSKLRRIANIERCARCYSCRV